MRSSVPQGLVGMQGGGPPTSAALRDRMLSATQRLQASSQSLEAARGVLNQAQVGVDDWTYGAVLVSPRRQQQESNEQSGHHQTLAPELWQLL